MTKRDIIMKNAFELSFTETSLWRDHAACVGQQELFFEEKSKNIVTKAKMICASCVVRTPCLEYALKNKDYGVWGGLTSNERRKVVRISKKITALSE
jgi:WhiB family redox-sensing transcriptional regulator